MMVTASREPNWEEVFLWDAEGKFLDKLEIWCIYNMTFVTETILVGLSEDCRSIQVISVLPEHRQMPELVTLDKPRPAPRLSSFFLPERHGFCLIFPCKHGENLVHVLEFHLGGSCTSPQLMNCQELRFPNDEDQGIWALC
eukprot:symbB.v1.2.002955.t1/scaffold164.1/size290097/9